VIGLVSTLTKKSKFPGWTHSTLNTTLIKSIIISVTVRNPKPARFMLLFYALVNLSGLLLNLTGSAGSSQLATGFEARPLLFFLWTYISNFKRKENSFM
jgi:hypothetical protein